MLERSDSIATADGQMASGTNIFTRVDDHRMMHGVTPVEPIDPSRPGFRDVLVVTFRGEESGAA